MSAPEPPASSPAALRVRPRAGASMAVFDPQGRILLIERGKGAPPGTWSFPGGHIEPGEKAEAAALREVREETSIEVQSAGLLDIQDILIRDKAGVLVAQYLLAVFVGRWVPLRDAPQEPHAGDDARQARFVAQDALDGYTLTPQVRDLIGRAWARLQD